MRILSEQECQTWLETHLGRSGTWRQIAASYPSCITYRVPTDSGKKTAIARALSHGFGSTELSLLWITSWGIFPSSENMTLFDAYRRSLGESRDLHAAPGHVFAAPERSQLECLLDLVLYFYWDASLIDAGGKIAVQTSHDEYLSIYAADQTHFRRMQTSLEAMSLSILPSSQA